MATPYSGNKDAVQSPNGALARGATVKVSLPQDTDGNTVANFYNPLEVPADGLTYLLNSSLPDFPVVNASGSGFTTPVNTALGGTVTPSGSVHLTDGIRFVIKIILGGAVGVATFQTSMDGGVTYGGTQTTAASMTDATSGITLAFVGTFTANGTAAFRSAFTPLAQWNDALGNPRGIVDHNGYVGVGRVNAFDENWGVVAPSALTVGSGSSGQWDYSIATGGVTQKGSAGADIPATVISHNLTGMTTGNNILLRTNTAFMSFQTFTSVVFWWEMKMNTIGANNCDWFVGLSNVDGGTPATSNCCGVGKQSSDTNWQLITGNNSGAPTKTNTGIVPIVSTAQKFALEFFGSTTQYAGMAVLWINGVPTFTTSTLPIAAQPMKFHIDGTTVGTSTMSFTVGPVSGRWNRYASVALY